MAEVEKLEAMQKCKRARKATRYVGYVVISATTAAISCFVLWFPSLVDTVKTPLRVLCLVVIPELWVMWQNPGFLFIVCNVIILTLVAKSGVLSSDNGSTSHSGLDLYSEFIKKSESMPKYYIVDEKEENAKSTRRPPAKRVRKCRRQEETVAHTNSRDQDKSMAEGASVSSSLIVSMSDEELNKRVEDFIANFNRQLQLQRQLSWSRGGR